MSAMPNPAQSEFSPGSLFVKPPIETPAVRLADLKNERFPNGRPLLGKRALLAFARFLNTFCIGVGAALAWQSYGDEAREMIANSYPQLGWLAPRPAPTAQNAPDAIARAAPAAPSPDQQLNAMSLDPVRQSVDRIATSQEQITRSIDRIAASQEQIARTVDRLTAGQEQMTREITKLQGIAQYMLYKSSE